MNRPVPLWTWPELCSSLGLPPNHGPEITGIQFDSRLIQPGELFVPLPGDPGPRFQVVSRSNRDGHDYILNAINNGAVGVIKARDTDYSIPNLPVTNTIDALWTLGRSRRQQLRCPVVAVTGSSGKTTLKAILQSVTDGFSAHGSFNNYIGLPLSLATTPKCSKLAIYEIGTNHPGEIGPLSKLAQPTIAVVLNVLPVHIGNFNNLEALKQEKFDIAQGLTQTGSLVLPYSLKDMTSVVKRKLPVLTFGFDTRADIYIEWIEADRYAFTHGTDRVVVNVPGGGQHRAETVAACGAVLVALNLELEYLRELETTLPAGRGQQITVNNVTIVDDSYNANPISVIGALRVLSEQATKGRKIAVLGQMNELGTHAKQLHESIASELQDVDVIYCVGSLMHHLFEKLESPVEKYFFEQANDELLNHLTAHLHQHDTVLVKGSNSVFWQANFVQQLHQALS